MTVGGISEYELQEWSSNSTVPVFTTEGAASLHLRTMLDPYFVLVPEVWMQHIDGSRLRLDFIAIPKGDFPADMFGIEVKRTPTAYREFCQALKQGIDYRHSRIVDKRAVKFAGAIPKFVFAFPLAHFTSVYSGWVEGALRLAGRYNVGTIDVERAWWPYGVPNRPPDPLVFRVSTTPIWRSDYGSTGNSRNWRADRGRGCA